MARTVTEIVQDHLARRLKGDIEGDIRHNFAKDILILSSFGVFRGHDGIRESAAKLDHELGSATFNYNHTLIEGDYAFLEWTGESNNKIVRDGADSFVVKDDRIVLQTIHYTSKSK